jgi:hypothetical protein
MTNAFDSANYPTTEPTELVAGDMWRWKRSDLNTDYPNSAYTLKYALRLQGAGTTEIEIAASASGLEYIIEVGSSTTAPYIVGRYTYQTYITRNSDSERITIGSGEIQLLANRDQSTTNPITNLRQRLENLETAILNLTTKTASAYSIAGRSFSYVDLPELQRMRDQTAGEINTKTRKTFGIRQ